MPVRIDRQPPLQPVEVSEGRVIEVNEANFQEIVQNSKEPVVIDAYATWCPPCRMLAPIFERVSLSPEMKDVKFVRFNVDENPTLTGTLGIQAMPTLLFFKKGQSIHSSAGLLTGDALTKKINEYLLKEERSNDRDATALKVDALNSIKPEKVVIIGSGPAAYTAGIYAARAELKPVIYEGNSELMVSGGQLMSTTDVENYPGFPEGIQGPSLVKKMRDQSERFGTKFVKDNVVEVDLSQYPFVVKGKEHIHKALAIIIATGAQANRLDIPGTRDGELWQKGVSACAVCDGALPRFRNRTVYVIGGGDSALEEATFLTKFAEKVIVVNRSARLRASKIMQKRAAANPKITILLNSVLKQVNGNNSVESVVIENITTHKKTTHKAAGVFFAVGHTPNTKFLKGQLELTPNGYIKVVPGTPRTNKRFVYSPGDVSDAVYRQAVTAASTGAMAALDAARDLDSD